MHSARSRSMHGDIRRVLIVPGALGAFGISTRDNLCAIGINHRDVVWTDTKERSVLIVKLFEHMMTVHLQVLETEGELGQASEIRTRNFVERIEEQAIYGAVCVNTKEVDCSQTSGLRQANGESYIS